VQRLRKDKTCRVSILLLHHDAIKRIQTEIYIPYKKLKNGKEIKDPAVLTKCNEIISKCREYCINHTLTVSTLDAGELKSRIEEHLAGKSIFRLNFISFAEKEVTKMSSGTERLYKTTINSLKRFLDGKPLDIKDINVRFLEEFENFIRNEPSQRGSNRKEKRDDLPLKGGRAISLYLTHIRKLHNSAKSCYNDEDRGIINIPYAPFERYKIKQESMPKKRALPIKTIQKIIDLPYQEEDKRAGEWNRFNLAKDCFLLSFAMIGMNSADMYSCNKPKDGILIYNREKTVTRRRDRAEMRVLLPPAIANLLKKYEGETLMFNFHNHYANSDGLDRAINKGLKIIGKAVGVDDLQFYAARHSWATIACSSKVGISESVVDAALNHSDPSLKVARFYIERDWKVLWNANKKVLRLFKWDAIFKMNPN
jgi:integrase